MITIIQKHLVPSSELCEIAHFFRLEGANVELGGNRPQDFPAIFKHRVQAVRHNSFTYLELKGHWQHCDFNVGFTPSTKIYIHNLHVQIFRGEMHSPAT